MKTFGALYVGKLAYYHRKPLPVIEVGKTQEIDFPYRNGKCLVFRVPFTKPGFYIGVLKQSAIDPHRLTDEDIDQLLMNAMRGRKAWDSKDGLFDEFRGTDEDF